MKPSLLAAACILLPACIIDEGPAPATSTLVSVLSSGPRAYALARVKTVHSRRGGPTQVPGQFFTTDQQGPPMGDLFDGADAAFRRKKYYARPTPTARPLKVGDTVLLSLSRDRDGTLRLDGRDGFVEAEFFVDVLEATGVNDDAQVVVDDHADVMGGVAEKVTLSVQEWRMLLDMVAGRSGGMEGVRQRCAALACGDGQTCILGQRCASVDYAVPLPEVLPGLLLDGTQHAQGAADGG